MDYFISNKAYLSSRTVRDFVATILCIYPYINWRFFLETRSYFLSKLHDRTEIYLI